jgi:hypothetical protein
LVVVLGLGDFTLIGILVSGEKDAPQGNSPFRMIVTLVAADIGNQDGGPFLGRMVAALAPDSGG